MLNYTIKKITQVDRRDLEDFYKLVFKNRYKSLIQNLEWWYRLNDTKCEPIVLILNNKIIGHLGLLPTKIKFNGKIKNASWYIDFAVLPEFQGKGAGSTLVKAGTNLSDIQLAFCNQAALKVYQKLNWKINYLTQRLVRPINPIKWVPILKKTNLKILKKIYNFSLIKKTKELSFVEPINFNENMKAIEKNFSNRKNDVSNNLIFVRDSSWFEWRFSKFPYRENLRVFQSKDNYLITHFQNSKGIKRVHVLFHFYLNESYEVEMYYLATKWAIENNFDLIWSCSANKNLTNKLRSIFPKIFHKPIIIASNSGEDTIYKKLELGVENIQAADSDMDTFFLGDI